jgi:hypothetical protein
MAQRKRKDTSDDGVDGEEGRLADHGRFNCTEGEVHHQGDNVRKRYY